MVDTVVKPTAIDIVLLDAVNVVRSFRRVAGPVASGQVLNNAVPNTVDS